MRNRLLLILAIVLLGGGFYYGGLIKSLVKPAFIAAAVTSASPSPSPTETVTEPGMFHYDALGIKAPITYLVKSDAFNPEDWDKFTDALNKGVSVSTPAETVESAHTLYITGHSSTAKPNPYSFVFAGLGQSKDGETFTITTDTKRYTYKVLTKQVINPADEQAFTQLEAPEGSPQRALLVTCWPVFTTKNRLVVVGELMP